MRKTRAQRYNDNMDKIFETARKNNIKYNSLHLFQLLSRLVEKVERANSIRHSGGRILAEDWSELYAITNQAKSVLETAKLIHEKEAPQ